MIARPPYCPQFGQITCDGFMVPHFAQACSCFAFRAWCERRMPVREFDCLRLGTAMGTPVSPKSNQQFLGNPLRYGDGPQAVKGGHFYQRRYVNESCNGRVNPSTIL